MSFTSDTCINPAETGLYYLGSRYYSPELCRFISADTTEVLHAEPLKLTSKNLYSYCDNNPISKTDSNGEIAIAAIGAIVCKAAPGLIGAGLNVLSSWIVAEASGEKFGVSDMFVSAVSGYVGAYGKIGFLTSVTLDCVYEFNTKQDTFIGSNYIEALFFESLSIPGMLTISGIGDDMGKVLMSLLEFSSGTSIEVIDVVYGSNSLNKSGKSSASLTEHSSEIVYKRMAGEWFPIR